MDKLFTLVERYCLFLVIIVVGCFFAYPIKDADLGWHLRYGQEYWQTKTIVTPNHFSWAMADYVWPNHSWGYDLILARLFDFGSFTLLSIVAGALVALAVVVVIRAVPKQQLISPALLALFFFGSQLLDGGLKSQLVSLLLTALLWYVLTYYQRRPGRWIVLILPLLFVTWVNLHGQFIVGLLFVGLWLAGLFWSKSSSQKTSLVTKHLLLAVMLAGGATLVNPFGWGLWSTAVAHLDAPTLKAIYEWMAWELVAQRLIALIAYTVTFWVLYRAYVKSNLPQTLVLVASSALALQSRRMIPVWLILSLPYLAHALANLSQQKLSLSWQQWVKRANLLALLIMAVIIPWHVVSSRPIAQQSWSSYCDSEILCSESLITFLKEHHIQGRLYNSYRLGSFLIYHYPQEKVFVDGRMSVWQTADGRYPYADYLDITQATAKGKSLFENAAFDYAILQPQYPFATVLKEIEHWPVIFDDGRVLVFQRPTEGD